MGLFEKLVGPDEDKIAIHSFTAALQEWEDGQISRTDIIAAYNLDASDEADLDFIKAQFLASADKVNFRQVLESILILGEDGKLGYDLKATFVARINALP